MEFKRLVKKRSGNKLLYWTNMDMMFEAYLAHESGHLEDDIPQTREPVWILGKTYSAIHDFESIRKDIKSRLWFSYRKGFVAIGDSSYTSDKGWGCMLRCGQMLIAQALINLHLGRDWEWTPSCHDVRYLKLLKMFEDRRSAPYSIHQIALMGASEGKQVGDWFGPNTVAQVLKKLSAYDEWSNLAVHVALDNTIVVNEIRKLCTQDRRGREWKPLALIIPLRLGINEINSVYINSLKTCFTMRQSIGVIGGKPNHALYFIGCVGNDVIFLDPHTTQNIGFVERKEMEHERKIDASYHLSQASRSHILRMDPSIAVGFFCKTENDFDSLCHEIKERFMLEKQPLFELVENRHVHKGQRFRQFDDSDEDFELLG